MTGTPAYPYILDHDVVKNAGTGIPAQGNTDPPEVFNFHWISLSGNIYFDPSYGTTAVSGANKDKLYEDSAFDGFINATSNMMRRNDTSPPSVSETKFIIDN